MLRAEGAEIPIPGSYDLYIIDQVLFAEEGRIMEKLTELHQTSGFYGEMPHLGDEHAAVKQSILSASNDLAAVRSAARWVSLTRMVVAGIESRNA